MKLLEPIKQEWLDKFLASLSGPGKDVGYHLAAQVEQLRAENEALKKQTEEKNRVNKYLGSTFNLEDEHEKLATEHERLRGLLREAREVVFQYRYLADNAAVVKRIDEALGETHFQDVSQELKKGEE